MGIRGISYYNAALPLIENSLFNDVLLSAKDTFKHIDSTYPFDYYVNESTNDHILEYAMAGIPKEWIKVKVSPGEITIKVEKPNNEDKCKFKFFKKGISQRNMDVKWRFNDTYHDSASTVAKFADGILTILIPMKKESVPRDIDIDID